MKLMIVKSALETIKKESQKAETETGGLLIGTLKKPVVLRASGPGPLATKSWAAYSNDPDYDNWILEKAIEEFGGKVKNIGNWHKHPGIMSSLSETDLKAALKIAKRNCQDKDYRPVYYIVTNVVSDEVKFYCYTLDQNSEDFMKVEIEIIEDNSEEIEKALNLEPVIIQTKTMEYWRDLDFQFYLTKAGYERLIQEVEQLAASGYEVKAHVKGLLSLSIQKGNYTLICLPPPEYPLNPPRFFRGNIEVIYSLPIWNSSFSIAEILRSLDHSTNERRSNENHRVETSSRILRLFEKCERALESLWHN